MKRLILMIFFLLSTTSLSYGYNYNESYTDIYLDSNGWCANLEIIFQAFNATEYESKKEIIEDLCEPGCKEDCDWDSDEDCIECEHDCTEFDYIEGATVKIYDGPLDSLSVLLETKTNETGQFRYTFPSAQQHLIEIIPDEDENPHYNDFHSVYDLYTCGHAQNTTIKEEVKKTNPPTPKDVELEYPSQGITLAVKHTTMNSTGAFVINENIVMPTPLENTIRYFEITASDDDFSTIEMQMMIDSFSELQTPTLLWYNPLTSDWENKNFHTAGDEIIFDATDLGIYAITQKPEGLEHETSTSIEEQNPQQQNEESKEEKETIPEQSTTKQSNKSLITGIIIAASLLLIAIIFVAKEKKKKKHYHENDDSKKEQNQKEVLTTYEATYLQTKKYIQKYKESFGKDSLYRALEEANVPKDIIDRVFNEEY